MIYQVYLVTWIVMVISVAVEILKKANGQNRVLLNLTHDRQQYVENLRSAKVPRDSL